MRDLYRNLSYLREVRGLTYREWSIRADVTERSLWTIVNGKTDPRQATLIRLASAVEVPVGDLYLEHGEFRKRYRSGKD